MRIKEKFSKVWSKVKEYDYKKIVTTKAFIASSCVLMVCVAVLISTLVGGGTGSRSETSEEGNKILGNSVLVDAEVSGSTNEDVDTDVNNTEDFFAMAIINRTQVRDSAIEVLREIAESPDSLPDAKEDALASIAEIADDMSAEANIETLIKAKGIADCIAVISDNTCSVVVNTSGLLPEELVQITEIVYEQAGIPVANITVVEAKKSE